MGEGCYLGRWQKDAGVVGSVLEPEPPSLAGAGAVKKGVAPTQAPALTCVSRK